MSDAENSWDFLPEDARRRKQPMKDRCSIHPVVNPFERLVASTPSETEIQRLRARVEELNEELAMEKATVGALRGELAESKRTAKRAIELSTRMAAMEEENERLRSERNAALGRHDELESLNQVQLELIARLDAEADSAAVQKDLIASLCNRSHRKRVASFRCPDCIIHAEKFARDEIAATERCSWDQILFSYDTITSARRFASTQCIESETRQMAEEDVRSHQRELAEQKRHTSNFNALRCEMMRMRHEIKEWKDKYRSLKESGRLYVEELERTHEQNLKNTRLAYLRCNPNVSFVAWMLTALAKVHCGYLKVSFAAAAAQKQTGILRASLADLRRSVSLSITHIAVEVNTALRRCMPVVWMPLPRATAFSAAPAVQSLGPYTPKRPEPHQKPSR